MSISDPYTKMTTLMMMILTINLMTAKTSMLCINLVLYIALVTYIMSLKIKTTPLPFITFLTMVGGLMIIFLYFTCTMWKKKEIKTSIKKMKWTLPTMLMLTNLQPSPKTYTHMTEILMFSNNFSNMTMILIMILMLILICIIEMHSKQNSHYRRKMNIWN